MDNAGWVVVKGGSKGGAKTSKPLSNDKKENKSNKKQPAVSKPLYSYEDFKLDDKPIRKSNVNGSKTQQKPEPVKIVAKPVKKPSKPVSSKARTIQDAVRKLNVTDLQTMIDKLQSQYANKPLVWLVDVAQTLNIKLNPSVQPDPAYRHETKSNAPLSYYTEPFIQYLTKILDSCGDAVIGNFYIKCCAQMIDDANKGLSVHGFATFIMLVQREFPDVCVKRHAELDMLSQFYVQNTRPFISHSWLMGNAMRSALLSKQPSVAIDIFMNELLPHVGHKLVSDVVVDAAEGLAGALCDMQETLQQSDNSSLVSLLSSLMRVSFVSCASVPRTITRQVAKTTAKLQSVFTTESLMVEAIELFLKKNINRNESLMLSSESSQLCADWLKHDKVWAKWLQLLPRHVPQSQYLVKHIQLENYSGRNLRKLETAVASVPESTQSRELSRVLCQRLSTISTGPSPLSLLLRVLGLYLVFAVALSCCRSRLQLSLPGPLQWLDEFNQKLMVKPDQLNAFTDSAIETLKPFTDATLKTLKTVTDETLKTLKPFTDSALETLEATLPGMREKLNGLQEQLQSLLYSEKDEAGQQR